MTESIARVVITATPVLTGRDPSGSASGAFRLTACDTADCTVVALSGELDVATAPVLDDYFSALDTSSRARLVVDVADLAFCGCAGLGALLRARRGAVAAGGWLRLCGATPGLRRLLRVTDLSQALPCYRTAADAFAGRLPSGISAAEVSGPRC